MKIRVVIKSKFAIRLIYSLHGNIDTAVFSLAYGRCRAPIIQSEGIKMYEDKTLICKDCGNEFVFTAGEQEFYAEKGFENEPQRCKDCRVARKNAIRQSREMHDVICADCGAATQVPFKPKDDRPVYCSNCFENHR